MNPVNIRLLNQHLCCPQYANPTDVVSHMGAMQAQEYRMVRWAVEMRTKRPSAKAFEKAFNNGDIIRLHLLRGTWQLVAAEDYWWMIDLCGEKGMSIIKGWMSSNKISIADDELIAIRKILLHTASAKTSVTKDDFVEALAEKGITMDNHRLSYHIRMAEYAGLLCSGDLTPMKATYSLTERKLKSAQHIDRDEALMRLTRKYFDSHQPATLEDFVWWSGLSMSDCKKGIELLGQYIHCERWKRREFYLTDNCRTRGVRSNQFLLIAPYDEYLIGYKSRDIAIEPQHSHNAYSNNGIFKPIITHNGKVCGNWSPFNRKCETTFFDYDDDASAINKRWEEYKQHLNI